MYFLGVLSPKKKHVAENSTEVYQGQTVQALQFDAW